MSLKTLSMTRTFESTLSNLRLEQGRSDPRSSTADSHRRRRDFQEVEIFPNRGFRTRIYVNQLLWERTRALIQESHRSQARRRQRFVQPLGHKEAESSVGSSKCELALMTLVLLISNRNTTH